MTINISDFIDFCTKINSRDYLDNRVIMSLQFLDNLKRKSEDKKHYQLIKESINLIERNLESSKSAIERQIKINP